MDINGTKIEFSENGNPNIGYSVIQWLWSPSGAEFNVVGSYFQYQLSINKSSLKWYTNGSGVTLIICQNQLVYGNSEKLWSNFAQFDFYKQYISYLNSFRFPHRRAQQHVRQVRFAESKGFIPAVMTVSTVWRAPIRKMRVMLLVMDAFMLFMLIDICYLIVDN